MDTTLSAAVGSQLSLACSASHPSVHIQTNTKSYIPLKIYIHSNLIIHRLRRMAKAERKNSYKIQFTSFDRFHPLLDRVSGFKKIHSFRSSSEKKSACFPQSGDNGSFFQPKMSCFFSLRSSFPPQKNSDQRNVTVSYRVRFISRTC